MFNLTNSAAIATIKSFVVSENSFPSYRSADHKSSAVFSCFCYIVLRVNSGVTDYHVTMVTMAMS